MLTCSVMSFEQYLKILAHPVFTGLNFHMPMVIDLSYPLVMLTGENGSGKSTLLHSIHYAMKGETVEGYVYQSETNVIDPQKVYLFDAEQHNPRNQLHMFENDKQMHEFLQVASHGQVMLSLFKKSFPKLPNGTTLLLDEPEMALSESNQRRILKMLLELIDQKNFRIITATHSPILINSKDTYVIDLDKHVNKNVIPNSMGVEGESTLH